MNSFSTTDFLQSVSHMISWVLPILGVGLLVIGGIKVVHKFTNPHSMSSWGSVIMPIILGGSFLVGGMVSTTGSKGSDDGGGASKSPSPSATPTPTHTPTPTPTPAKTQDPITLPKVENLQTLWLIPIALIVLIILFIVLKKFVLDARRARLARDKLQARLVTKWQVFVDRHRDLKKNYLAAETDWDMLFSYPALTDVSVPATAAMIRAMHAADDVDANMPADLDETTSLTELPYPKAVGEFQSAWDVALRNAKKIGQDGIPRAERENIAKIRRLLALAENSASSVNERETAYTQAYKLIKELRSVSIPDRALLHIEDAKRLAIQA